VNLGLIDGNEADEAEGARMLHAEVCDDIVQRHAGSKFDLHLARLHTIGNGSEK
jgi:hypothetical protein